MVITALGVESACDANSLPALRMPSLVLTVAHRPRSTRWSSPASPRLAFDDKADGSLVERDGEVVGSVARSARPSPRPEYFHTRPSAAGAAASGTPTATPTTSRPASASGASNLGPTNPDLLGRGRRSAAAAYREANGLAADAPVPVDAVTASGSGLDPHISVANARLQAPRVAEARGLDRRARSSRLVDEHTDGRSLGFLGEPASTCWGSTWPSTGSRTGRVAWPRWPDRRLAEGRCASTSAPRPAWARPSPCSTRAGAGAERGTDVVVGYVETHGRPSTAAQLARPRGGAPPARSTYRGATFEEMDLDAVLARRPEVALVDELAHTNVPGQPQREALAGRRGAARRRHRRDLHGQHPAPRVAQRRGRADHRASSSARPSPTHVVRAADQIELVDMTPEALRRRMAHGNIYAAREGRRRPRQLLPARQPRPRCGSWPCSGWPTGSTRPSRTTGNGTASPRPWETRERVVVAVTGAPGRRAPDPAGGPHRPARPTAS